MLATCNRVEVYADVDRFHGGVEALSGLLLRPRGGRAEDARPHLYVHYDDGAVSAPLPGGLGPGLDGRRRGPDPGPGAGRAAGGQEPAPSGRRSTRSSSRPCASASGRTPRPTSTAPRPRWSAPPSTGRPAGSATSTGRRVAGRRCRLDGRRWRSHRRHGAGPARSSSPTALPSAPPGSPREYGVPVRSRWPTVDAELADADLVVSCTGATGRAVVDVAAPRAAGAERPLAVVDLALPRDVDPAVGDLPGVTLVDARRPRRRAPAVRGRRPRSTRSARSSPRRSAAFLVGPAPGRASPRRSSRCARWRPGSSRPSWRGSRRRLPDLDPRHPRRGLHDRAPGRRQAAARAHRPGQGARQRVAAPSSYAAALAELFDLDPEAVEAVTRPEVPVTARPCWRGHVTPRSASAPAPPARPHPVPAGGRRAHRGARARRRAGRGDHRGRPRASGRLAQLGGTGVFVERAARGAARGEIDLAVHSLKDLPTGAGRRHRARRRTRARGPARRRSSPATGSPSASCRPGARVGTGSPRRAAQLHALGLGLDVVGVRGQRRHPDRARSATASSTPSCWPAPGWPGSAGSTRSPRCSTRSRCCPPPARARSRSSAARRRPRRRRLAALDDPATRAAVDAERAVLAALEAGCSAPVGALAEVVEGDDGDELWLRAVALSTRRRRCRSDVGHRRPSRRRRLGAPAGRGDARRGRRSYARPTPEPAHRTSSTVHRLRRGKSAMTRAQTSTAPPGATGARRWVSFVGSGPGDPGLLTVRAVELLRRPRSSSPRCPSTRSAWSARSSSRPPGRRGCSAGLVDGGFGEDGQPLTHAARAKVVVRRPRPAPRRPADVRRPVRLRLRSRGGAGLRQGRRRLRDRARRLVGLRRPGLRRHPADHQEPPRGRRGHRRRRVDWSAYADVPHPRPALRRSARSARSPARAGRRRPVARRPRSR